MDVVAAMENSMATRQFNKVFAYIEEDAKKVENEEDEVEANVRSLL